MEYNNNITLNDFEKLRILGEGTYGKCYLVQNKLANQLCVLKQIEIFGMSQSQQKEVMKEATILSALDHPCIIKFLFLFKTDSYLNIVMEYADGGDLNRIIKEAKGNHFSETQILNWFTQICLAIKHIHDRKIIHRDLKCQNIFMTKEGFVKLGDFGIAKNLSKTLQKIKTIVGTPYYMSPQICQNKDYSIKTDIWSLGVILYEMCALKLPFQGGSLPALALKISRGQYPAVTANYSRDLKALIKSLLQNSPAKRPSISKILQNPLISKRVAQYLPKIMLVRQFSLAQINNRSAIQKQNDQQNFQQSFKDKSEVEQKKNEINSARNYIQKQKSNKTPQASKNIEVLNKLKQFGSNSKSGKVEREKKKKGQLLKRRQISQPNLAVKKFSKNQNLGIQQVPEEQIQYEHEQEQEQENEQAEEQQSLISTLRELVQKKLKQKSELKILETSDGNGLAGQNFEGNGIVSLLWGLQNLNIQY